MKRIQKRYEVVSTIVVFLLAMPVAWGILFPLLEPLPRYWAGAIKYTISLLVGLALYRTIPFTIENKYFCKGLFSFGMLGLICAGMAFLFSFSEPDHTPSLSTIVSYVLYTLAIALSEECLFRGLMLNAMLKRWESRRQYIWMAIVACSTIFGLRHLLNLITMPNTVVSTIGQVGFTFMAGFYLCAVYLRTRNIWICVCIHFLEDFFTGFWSITSTQAAMQEGVDGPVSGTILLVAVHSIYVIFGILMLRDKKWKYQSLIREEQSSK